MPTQLEYNIVKQKNKKIYAKIDLLDENFKKVDEIQGVVLGNPTFANNSNSDIRRTCDISIFPKDESFNISYGNKIWLDRYIQVYLGIENIRTKEIIYTNMGIYMIENPSRTYSETSNTISIQGIDLMAKMTGMRNGNLDGVPYIIPEGSDVRNVIIETIELAGFTNYIVEQCPILTPYEITIDVGGTVYDILKELCNILPNYQMYFDVDGVFHYEQIPNGENEQIMVNDDMWKNTLISYSQNNDFDGIKNCIEVFGKTHDISNFCEATIEGNDYVLIINNVTTLEDGIKMGFVAPIKISNPKIKLNSFGEKELKDEYGKEPKLYDSEEVYYVIKYVEDGDYFMFMGEITPYGVIEETNPQSPYYVEGTMGKVRIVLSGGEYDNIYTSNLAQERAEWELYKRCKLQDNLTLQTIPMYWLDVNWLIEITLPNKNGIEETNKYLIKSINTTFGENGTQTIELMRFYPYYPSLKYI